ncbi:protein lev-9-like [Dreissena polymorpha]|uniref:protein lev-9-like n=1 Tax=Dreissena polymorpha TaxID=45954 RepID=UPI0022647243|nr:protein lev-9-like [Dreissena polymorpha]
MAYDQECSVTAECGTTGATCRNDGLGSFRCLCTPSGEIYVPSSETCLKECGDLKNPTNGEVTLPTNTTEGQMASYWCMVGYVLSGPKLRTRQSNGKWSDAEPACIFDSRPDTTVPFGVMIAILGLFDLVVVAVYIKHRCRGQCMHRIYTNRPTQHSNFDSELSVTNSMQYSAKHREAEKAKRGSVRSPRTGSAKSIHLSNYIGN